MNIRRSLVIAGLSGVLVGGIALSAAQHLPPQPHLYHLWTDAKGDTHLEEIKLGNNKRAPIPGVIVNFSGLPASEAAKLLHNSPARQFAVTVSGQIDVEASDGTKAHLNVGDMAFLEDTTGKGHKTLEEGAGSVFLRVPADFDVKTWAKGE